jgi:hypothetical protein
MKTRKNLAAALIVVLLTGVQLAKAQGEEWGQPVLGGSQPCIPTATSWFLGGNIIPNPIIATCATCPPPPPQPIPVFDVGTCNNFPFVLKANNLKSVFILPAGKIGINNPNPQAALDVRNPNASAQSSFRIFADPWGNVESTVDMRLYYATGKNFMLNEGTSASGTSYTNRLFVQNTSGNVGIGTTAPSSKFEVVDHSAVRMNIYSSAVPAASSKIWVSNTAYSYNFGIDNTGIGRIGSNINYANQINLINFRTDANDMPMVWIGNKKPQGVHADFSFAVQGKIVAQSVYVTAAIASNWADYVFEKDYKLPRLAELEKYYLKNKHLPEVPSTQEVAEKGIDLGEMNTLLLKKVEELTLYVVDLNKKVEVLQKQNERFKNNSK